MNTQISDTAEREQGVNRGEQGVNMAPRRVADAASRLCVHPMPFLSETRPLKKKNATPHRQPSLGGWPMRRRVLFFSGF